MIMRVGKTIIVVSSLFYPITNSNDIGATTVNLGTIYCLNWYCYAATLSAQTMQSVAIINKSLHTFFCVQTTTSNVHKLAGMIAFRGQFRFNQ